MNGSCWLVCWVAAGFLLCNWEVPTGSLGMPFTNESEEMDVVVIEEVGGDAEDRDAEDRDAEDRDAEDGDAEDGDTEDGDAEDGDAEDGDAEDGDAEDGDAEDGDAEDGDEVDEDGDDGGGDCVLPTNSSDPVGLRGYKRYFANDSLIGRPVPCSRDDKICFRHNLIFNPNTDKCEQLWDICGDNGVIIVNRTELEDGSGRVVSSCSDHDWQCYGYIMAYDGLCYRTDIVRDIICGCNATHTPHIFGGEECRVDPMTPIGVQQPEDVDSCVIPDFRNPDPRRSMLPDEPLPYELWKKFKCGPDQGVCFSEGKILVPGYDGCHTLLKRGPCAEDHVVALDLQAAIEGRAEGTCVHVRGGCPKGHKRMLFDGECHEDREIQIEAPGKIVLDDFGRYFINHGDTEVFFNAEFDGNQRCIIRIVNPSVTIETPVVGTNPLFPPCGTDDSGRCSRLEVLNISPMPEL